MPIKTWVGRFTIVQGQAQEESALLRSFPRQRPDEEEDELYVLVDPDSPASEQYCEELADVIGRAFRQDTLSPGQHDGAVRERIGVDEVELVELGAGETNVPCL